MRNERLKKVAKAIVLWLPVILLALIFAPQGWSKFFDDSGWARAFRHWGYPDWFRVLVGVMELSGVALLLLGRTAAFGALVLICVMLGAMATHVIFDGGRHMTSEVVPLALSIIVLVLRRSQLSASLGRWRASVGGRTQ
jgi:putative oxidoreductase